MVRHTQSPQSVILGIDPGYGIMGYGCIQAHPQHPRCHGYGVLTTPTHDAFPDRLLLLTKDLAELLQRFRPHLVSIEKLFFSKNTKTALDVSQARGSIIATIRAASVPIVEYTPLQVKQSLTGYGRAEKCQIQKMVSVFLRLPTIPKPDDAADALAIALCAWKHARILPSH